MKKTADSQYDAAASISQEKIAERARALWESYGRPAGRDTEIWLEAERQLLGVDSQVEGSGGISVAASGFDTAVASGKPVTREDAPAQKKASAKKSLGSGKLTAANTPRRIKSKTQVAEDAPTKVPKKKSPSSSGKTVPSARGRK